MSDSTRTAHQLDPVVLSAYYDEMLGDDEQQEVEEHLARCPSCRERLASYATLGGGIRAGANPPVPPTLDAKISRLVKRYSPGRVAVHPRASTPRPRRRSSRSWPVWSALGIVVVLSLLAATYLFGLPFGGGGIGPTIAAAYPCNNPTECAIAVRFNGPVDHASVERSFRINPPVPVTFAWQDNTLFVKPTQPLQAAVSYTVSIQLAAAARNLVRPSAAKPTSVALHFVAGGVGSPVAMANVGGPGGAPTMAGRVASVAQVNQPTATPGGPATPSPTLLAASGAATAAVAIPAASATPCPIQPVRGFGTLYHDQPKVAGRLGCARAPEAGLDLIVEPFQHGLMLWLGDRRQIVALLDDGHWSGYPDTFKGTETVTPAPGEPIHGFGKVWRETPTLRAAIGPATAPEHPIGAVIEDFEHGTLVWTADRIIYALYSDGAWGKYADTYVDLTPTATATLTGTPAASTSATATTTPTVSASPTARPSPSESATPSPTASGNASTTPTSSPGGSTGATACPTRPVRGFGLVYRGHPNVASRLGCASAPEIGAQSTRETFEHGVMIRRDDVRQIFVIRSDGHWAVYPDTYQDGETLPDPGPLPAGKLAPVRGLAKVWLQQPGVRQALGWATAAEGPVSGAYEDFAAGQMVWTSDKTIYVLFSDGTSRSFPDTFVDPTATPAPP